MQANRRRDFLRSAVVATSLLPLRWAVAGMSPSVIAADGHGTDPVFPELFFHPGAPRNAEPATSALVNSWQTPVSQFFIRSHGLNPVIDMATYRLGIEGLVDRPQQWSLPELTAQSAAYSCTCTLTCAGNRRSEFSQIKPVSGVQWKEGAIGNAVWSGVRLADVLKAAGVQESARHVWFEGLDEVKDGSRTFPFGGSIPLSKVFEETESKTSAMLATQMNGQPLTIDHGMPVRTIVPGYIGARSVKWLSRIVVSDRPSPNHFVEDVYKIVETDTAIQRDETAPIYRFPVNSVICSAVPVKGAARSLHVTGYSLPAGAAGTEIATVELSADGGKTWQAAHLEDDRQEFCWRLWSADVKVSEAETSLVVRAVDTAGHQQPERLSWNPKGYLNNAWHRLSVGVR